MSGCICISREDIGVGVPAAYATWLADEWRRDCPVCGDPKCQFIRCPFYDPKAKGLCPPHEDYATRILGDPRYRTEQPPEGPLVNPDGSMQAVLL
jgi:hypothetical protein